MLENKDYCDYDTCVALEELGFPLEEDYGGVYIKSCVYKKPSLYEAQKFLREEIRIEVNAFYDNMDDAWRFYILEIDSPDLSGTHAYNDTYMSYEEALSKGIKEAVKILTNNKNE